jgi:Flp pilus assembly pilin Flp
MSRVQKARAPVRDESGLNNVEYLIIAMLALAVGIGLWKTFAEQLQVDAVDASQARP